MAFIDWSDRLDIGVFSMNLEHQKLIGLMNDLYDLFDAGAGFEETREALGALGAYAAEHFASEEAFMGRINYPGLSAHQSIHRRLLEQLGHHVEAFERTRALDREFFYFLRSWLGAHIRGVDVEYGFHARVSSSLSRY